MLTPIYLDYNATTPVDERVLQAMLPYFSSSFGNAGSRTHAYGWVADEAVKIAREQVASLIGCEPQELVFTSGSTESLNLAIKGVAQTHTSKGSHIIVASTEHKAVLDPCDHLAKMGWDVTLLPVGTDGLVSLEELRNSLRTDTVLVSVMLANNETGVLQPISEISELTRANETLFLCDATQAVGKVPVDVNHLGVDLLAFSAHKMYGPKGVGGLFVRRKNPRVRLEPQLHGGGHERGIRSGTLNVPGIVGLGKSCEVCAEIMEEEAQRIVQLRDLFEQKVLLLPQTRLNGHPSQRLEHVSNIHFGGVEAEALMMAMRGIAVSTGSACNSASMEPSHVLMAMGLSREEAFSSIRFSFGRPTKERDVIYAIDHVKEAVTKLRGQRPH